MADDTEMRPKAPADQHEPVKIGLIAPQTGGYKAIGDDITRGFRLFLEMNDSRLGGHPVQLLIADEGDTSKVRQGRPRRACSSRACWRSPASSTRR